MERLRVNEFKILSKIATKIPVRQIFYTYDINTLPKQCELINQDFRQLIENLEYSD
jgi:hypothetical protein